MPVKLLTSGGGGVNLVPSSSIASDQTMYLPTSGTSGGTVLCTDSSGNLGLGVTPSAWGGGINNVLQLTEGAFVAGWAYASAGFGSNAYYGSGWKYVTTRRAALYQQAEGVHSWHTAPSGTAGNAITFTQAMTLNTSGNAYNKTGVWGTISSDIRYKENIIDATPKLADVCSLRVVNFNYSADESKTKCLGFIAQEMEQIFPALVTTTDNRKYDEDGNVISGYEDSKGLKTGLDFAILVKAIQEQQAIIESLTQRIEALEYTKQGE